MSQLEDKMQDTDIFDAAFGVFNHFHVDDDANTITTGPMRISIGPGWAELVLVTGSSDGLVCFGYVGGRLMGSPEQLREVSNIDDLKLVLEEIRTQIIDLATAMLSACGRS